MSTKPERAEPSGESDGTSPTAPNSGPQDRARSPDESDELDETSLIDDETWRQMLRRAFGTAGRLEEG